MITLLAINIVSTIIFIYRYCFSKKGVEINHVFLFGLGFIYYWMLPVIVGEYRLFRELPMMGLWHVIYENILPSTMLKYLVFSLFFSSAFYGGHFLGKRAFVNAKNTDNRLLFDRKLLIALLLAICPAILYYVMRFRNSFFAFYLNEINVSSEKGQFISISLILLAGTLLYSHAKERKLTTNFSKVIFNPFTFVYLLVSLLILTMGGRLYFFSSIIMLLIYRSVYFEPIKRRITYMFFIGSIAFMGILGLFRIGTDHITFEGILFNVVGEPLYTGFSLISFLEANRIEWINAPLFLVSEFLNLIPTFILPSKAELFVTPEDYGYVVFSPLGAMNSFMSFIINFGMLGSVIAIFFFSLFMSYLKVKTNHRLFKIMYIMLSGWIPFTFFRDPFSVSIVKQMFQFSFLVPMLIVAAVLFFSNVQPISKERIKTSTS